MAAAVRRVTGWRPCRKASCRPGSRCRTLPSPPAAASRRPRRPRRHRRLNGVVAGGACRRCLC